MREINIAKTIIDKRREKGITQEELANFIGVSKSSVSKWETEQSYPDIVYLPQLAAYFNVSLDELMGYEPQMASEDISELYKELSNEFAIKPFDEVMNRCRDIVKKYFSCFPLVYRMALLYANYGLTSKDDEQKVSTLAEAKKLLVRVKEQSDDVDLKQLALYLEASCELMLGKPNELIDLLKDVKPLSPHPYKVLLSQAYLLTGKTKEAKMELQESLYFSMMELFDAIPPYLAICADDAERFEEVCKRAMALIDAFSLKELAPTCIMPFYLAAAQGYLSHQNFKRSLDILEAYTDIATSDIYPLKIVKSDDFFHLIELSAKKAPFGLTELPRDEKSIRQSMADAVIENPVFSVLFDDPRFKSLAEKLTHNIG